MIQRPPRVMLRNALLRKDQKDRGRDLDLSSSIEDRDLDTEISRSSIQPVEMKVDIFDGDLDPDLPTLTIARQLQQQQQQQQHAAPTEYFSPQQHYHHNYKPTPHLVRVALEGSPLDVADQGLARPLSLARLRTTKHKTSK